MNRKQLTITVLVAFFVGALGSILFTRFFIPYLGSIKGWESLNKLVSSSPIVVNRTTEVQLNDGVNVVDLAKQAGNITVSIYDSKNNFLGNGMVITSDGLVFTSAPVVKTLQQVNVITNDGSKYTGTVKSEDSKSGLVALTIPVTNFATVQFDKAADLDPGQSVIYIGRSNIKFEHTVLQGFITQNLNNELGTKLIMSNAQPNSDFFGGPIINLSGHVVGLVVGDNQNIIAEDLQTALNSYLSSGKLAQP